MNYYCTSINRAKESAWTRPVAWMLTGILLMLCAPSVSAWDGSEPYCNYIHAIYLDKTWSFDTEVRDAYADSLWANNGKECPEPIAPLLDAPGYISFCVLSWDDRQADKNDYNMDSCQIDLYNAATNEVLEISFLDFLGEDSDHKENWENHYKYEGNYNISTNPKYYRNMNGNNTRYAKKRLYRKWQEGVQFCYFVIRYSDSTRAFIQQAGNHLQVRLKGRFDSGDYHMFDNKTYWRNLRFIAPPSAATNARLTGWTEHDGATCLHLTSLPSTSENETLIVRIIDNDTHTAIDSTRLTESTAFDYYYPVSGWVQADKMNRGAYSVSIRKAKRYIQSRDGYDNEARSIVPDTVVLYSDDKVLAVPAVRLSQDLYAANQTDGTILLQWSSDASTDKDDQSDWVIERCTDNTWNANTTRVITLPNVSNKTTYSYLDTFDERDQNIKVYYYRVHRDYSITRSETFCDYTTCSVNTNRAAISAFNLQVDNGRIILNWLLTSGLWEEGTELQLLRNNIELPLEEQLHPDRYSMTGTYVDTDVITCTDYQYELHVQHDTKTISTVREHAFIRDTTSGQITRFTQSKGYYSDRIEVEWQLDSTYNNFNYFVLKRKVHGESDNTYSTLVSGLQRTSGVLKYDYTDQAITPGTCYTYRLEGWAQCGDSVASTTAICTGTGFASLNGVVNGQVLFESGQAVAGATVEMDQDGSVNRAAMLLSDSSALMLAEGQAAGVLGTYSGTAEMLIRPLHSAQDTLRLLSQQGNILWYLVPATNTMGIRMIRGGQAFTTEASLTLGNWRKAAYNHVAMTYLANNDSLTMTLYVNGAEVATSTRYLALHATTDASGPLYLHSFAGQLDDIRLWNICRSADQIASGYNRFLSGREEGLMGYYHLDEMLDGQVFDCSGNGSVFHENHLDIVGPAHVTSDHVPSKSVLSLRATTDATGNYLINSIPYSDSGTLYRIAASLGAHQFSPATKTLYFTQQSSTNNGVDFTDISSFEVSGTVVYAGGNYPVEGLMFKVDGLVQSDRRGELITTDSEGHFSLSVPVGVHTVQVYAQGHTLSNGGFITNIDGSDIDYQKPYQNILIEDSTRVRYIGRVCGGREQSLIAVGHTLSHNNLADGMELMLKHPHPDKYQLATTTWHDTIEHQTPSVYSVDRKRKAVPLSNRVDYNENNITIHINDSTGEFYADVFPIDYTLEMTIPEYNKLDEEGSIISFANMSELTDINQSVHQYSDSVALYNDSINDTYMSFADSIKCSKQQVFCLRVNPTVTVTQVNRYDRPMPYFGVASVAVQAGDESQYVQMYDTASRSYTLGLPIFTTDYGYRMHIGVNEIYTHYAVDGSVLSYDSVPTRGAEVQIYNTMLSMPQTLLTIDSTGRATYRFDIDNPNMSTAQGQLNIVVKYNDNNTLNWEPPFDPNGIVYYTGDHKTGSDYITAGPNKMFTILRDPPGANSYSFLDEGSTVSYEDSYSYAIKEGGSDGVRISLGTALKTVVGLGVAIENGAKAVSNIDLGYKHENSWENETTLELNLRSTRRYETSEEDVFVGAEGDLYVGVATNYTFATNEMIVLIDSADYHRGGSAKYPVVYTATPDSAYLLVRCDGVSSGMQFATDFAYTQVDILTEEIPRLEKILASLLVPYSTQDSIALQQRADTERKPYYMLKPGITAHSEHYAEPGSYYVLLPKLTAGHKNTFAVYSDSVSIVKDWIDGWKYYVGLNEYQKYKAIQTNTALVKNYSLSGGAKLEFSNTYEEQKTYKYNRTSLQEGFLNIESETEVEEVAYIALTFMLEQEAGVEQQWDKSATDVEEHTSGFVLQPNAYERLSVDVLHEYDWALGSEMPKPTWHPDERADANITNVIGHVRQPESFPSYVFYTRGGQTCCPYEGATYSECILDYLNMQIEEDALDTLNEKSSYDTKQMHLRDRENILAEQGEVKLNESTLQIDKPRLEIVNTYTAGVPSGESAYIRVRMSNESESGTDRPFYLVLKEDSNPNGASLTIDGTSIGTGLTGGSGVSYLIPAGTTLEKTLTFSRGSALDYDNIGLYMVAYCESGYEHRWAIRDSAFFSVHFAPACTDIEIKSPSQNWVYNTELDSMRNPASNKVERYLPIVLGGFDPNYTDFEHIELQYKPTTASDNEWVKAAAFPRDSVGTGEVRYALFLDSEDDRPYDLRAVSYCRVGNEWVENYSEVVSGTKDCYRPRPFGQPSPANGVLSVGDDIRLTFNEDIASGLLSYNNFIVSGLINETHSTHDVCVHLGGIGLLRTESSLHLDGAYTLEGWFRQTTESGEQTLFEGGMTTQQTEHMRLSIDAANKVVVLTSDSIRYSMPLSGWQSGDWNHVAVTRAPSSALGGSVITVYVNFTAIGSNTEAPQMSGIIDGPFMVGDGFYGDVDQVRIWDVARSEMALREKANRYYTHGELHMLSCYNMDEAAGTTLSDVVGGRTMTMQRATWAVPEGRALSFSSGAYAKLPLYSPLTNDVDYTLDFWFRCGETRQQMTLLATPYKDGAPMANGLGVHLDKYGGLFLRTDSLYYIAVDDSHSYNDNVWHHFTLAVGRSTGFARAYIDGTLRASVTHDCLGGLAADDIYLGATWLQDRDSLTDFYTGDIDEVRLFDLYRTEKQIELFHLHKADSTTSGLHFYYPFERYEKSPQGISSLVFSTENFCAGHENEAVTLVGASMDTESAPVATALPMTTLDQTGFTFTPNNNSVILTLTKPVSSIEHSILTFTARNIRDVNGNKMLSPATWCAYVDLNPLKVDRQDICLTTELNTTARGSFLLTNRSGNYCSFTIEGIPTWLEMETESSMMAPLESRTIAFTTASSLAVGTHTAHLYLANSDNTVIPMTIVVVVNGNVPTFDVDPSDFAYSMNIFGQMEINGVISQDERDILAVFDGEKCVGTAHTTYYRDFDMYLVNLTVYSDSLAGHPLSYCIYDASTGRTYKANTNSTAFQYQNNMILGSPAQPVVFYNTTDQYRMYHFAKGWNWISLPIVPANGFDLNTVFPGPWSAQDQIKFYDASAFASYSTGQNRWVGSLTTVDNTHLYMVYAEQPLTIRVLGKPVDAHNTPIALQHGWNGISYLGGSNLSVREALAGYQAEDNDVIKSQTEFAIRYNNSWVGSLKTLQSGEGYMLYRRGEATSFCYPNLSDNSSAYLSAPEREHLRTDASMTIVATAEGIEPQEGELLTVLSHGAEVGSARLTDGRWYLSIAGNATAETLHFVYRGAAATTTLPYRAHAHHGTPDSPVVLQFTPGAVEMSPELVAYPSPVVSTLYYRLEGAVSVSVYDMAGACLITAPATGAIDVEHLPTGTYMLRVSTADSIHYTKFIK